MQAVVAVFTILAAVSGQQFEFLLDNVVPALIDEDDPRSEFRRPEGELPIVVEPFDVHVRAWNAEKPDFAPPPPVEHDGLRWFASDTGLYSQAPGGERERHAAYGVDGPLASHVTALAVDSKGALWVGTPLGISMRALGGQWTHIRSRDGLPVEDVTALAMDSRGWVWIGTKHGAVQYRPQAEDRKWFYRGGQRYLANDHVVRIDIEPGDRRVWFTFEDGSYSAIDEITTTLLEKAESIERRVNERHRRFGLVAACTLDDAFEPTSHTIGDFDNDGLWTAYHVAAMSLCYAVTGDSAAKASARDGMHALYMLQNVSGTPGLVARSVLPSELGQKSPQWRLSPDGGFYWKSDTSSDEIDGHFLAFYTYWEHVARHDEAERDKCIRQVREVMDYIIDNGYQLIDWDGTRTRWGFWDPEALNNNPKNYVEQGLNSLQMLSFLNTAWHITGDAKYREHFEYLGGEHHYISNVLLSKKTFPDQHNHSDDQLGYVAWYPILQTEPDPRVREALQRGVRRHYKVVAPEQPSFYAFVTATIDPHYVDLHAAVENLRQIPEDQRNWQMDNGHRDDVVFDPRVDRFGRRQLLHVLPADERHFDKWNRNPYLPEAGGDGRSEDEGAAYLLPYWMGRYHGFIAEASQAKTAAR